MKSFLKFLWRILAVDKNDYQFFLKITRIFNRAVKKAREEHKKKGVPNVYCFNGKIIYELPDGSLTDKTPSLLE